MKNAKRTYWSRKLSWWWHGGARRLHAAQLRRQPVSSSTDYVPHLRALRYLLGEDGLSRLIIHSIRDFTNVDARAMVYRQYARIMTSPYMGSLLPWTG